MTKFLAVLLSGVEVRLYIVPANDKEHAHHILSQLARVKHYYAQSTAMQRPLFIHMIPIPEGDQVNQIYASDC